MVKTLAIFTAGGLARAVSSHFGGDWKVTHFIDSPRDLDERVYNIPVERVPRKDSGEKYVIACGKPQRRKSLAEGYGVNWTHLVHRTATFATQATLKEGTIICPGVVVDPDVKIDKHVYIDHNSVIGHGAEIGDYTVIAPLVLVAGYCKIGEGVHIGTGAKIVRDSNVGENSIIGAGAVVLKDVPPNEVWAGVPAKKIGETDG